MRFLSILLLALLAAPSSFAQINNLPQKEGEVLSKPICSALKNRSDVSIQGTLATAPQTLKNGDISRHRDNFRLMPGERKEFCVSGPFFEGRRIELTIRTLIPLFDCKTKITKEILLDSIIQDDGSRKYSATCS